MTAFLSLCSGELFSRKKVHKRDLAAGPSMKQILLQVDSPRQELSGDGNCKEQAPESGPFWSEKK